MTRTRLPKAELGLQVARLLPKIGNIVAKDVPTSDDEEKDSIVTSTFGPNPSGQQYMHHHEVIGANPPLPPVPYREKVFCSMWEKR